MNRINHITWTLGLSLWIYHFILLFGLLNSILYSILTASIAWLPDIDIKLINKINKFNKYTLYLLFPITVILKILFKHRRITHSLWIPITFYIFSHYLFHNNFFLQITFLIISLAILLHIIEDTFTIKGVDIFFPIPLNIRILKFNTHYKLHSYILETLACIIIIIFFLFL